MEDIFIYCSTHTTRVDLIYFLSFLKSFFLSVVDLLNNDKENIDMEAVGPP